MTSLLSRLNERLGVLESSTPTKTQVNELETKATEVLEKLCADIERKLAVKMREAIISRDKLQDEHRETQQVLSQMTTESLVRVHDVSQSRVQALEAQLLAERTERNAFERDCQGQWQKIHVALETITSQWETYQRTCQQQWRKWMDKITLLQNNHFNKSMKVGAGLYDITGPAAEVGMFGYARPTQVTSGIHMRLRARAFIFNEDDVFFAFVSVDTGCITECISRHVIDRLQKHEMIPTGIFTTENVMLSATHTHCAPGGLSEFMIYSMHPPLKGFERQNFECVVNGIIEAIARAYHNLLPGYIRVARGNCVGASVNRSIDAYKANPKEERAMYEHDTDKEMVLWRLDGEDGYPIGMINWFAVHPTSMGSSFTLITGDNKGYASHIFEREMGNMHLLDRPRSFVAAFAQSNEGDVSPNICGPRCAANEHLDLERMEMVGLAQLATARYLYAKAKDSPPIAGAIHFAHQYVDYNSIPLTEKWHKHKDCEPTTSPGCIGMSMLSGTYFDGRGISIIPEGMKWSSKYWLTLVPETQSTQKEKLIVFPTAAYGMSPSILPLQLVTIADTLAIGALPFETTTMAGRRLRATIHDALNFSEDKTVILAGLSNAYCGYMTTREEFAVQRYEGASTHFGPNQLCATQQQFELLAHALKSNNPVETLPPPTNSKNMIANTHWHTPVIVDSVPFGTSFGDIVNDVSPKNPEGFHIGDTVKVTFYGGHPKNDLRTQSTFLEIQRFYPHDNGGYWKIVADDADENTFYHWKRIGVMVSHITIEWKIKPGTPQGKYRIKHTGNCKPDWIRLQVISYHGFSSEFQVLDTIGPEAQENALKIIHAEPESSCTKRHSSSRMDSTNNSSDGAVENQVSFEPKEVLLRPEFSIVIDPAWDNTAFNSMMQSDLLTYSLSLSVAPMAKAMETMGTSIQKHDENFAKLMLCCRHLDQDNKDLLLSTDAMKDELKNQLENSCQGVRADLLALIHPLEIKSDALTQELAATTATIQTLLEKKEEEEKASLIEHMNPAMPQLERLKMIEDKLRECATSKHLDALRNDLTSIIPDTSGFVSPKDLAALKDEMIEFMQNQLSDLQIKMQEQFNAQLDAVKAESGNTSSPQLLQNLKRSQSYNTALKPSTVSLKPKETSATVDMTQVNRRFDQEEELLEALRQQCEAFQDSINTLQADTTMVKDKLNVMQSSALSSLGNSIPLDKGAVSSELERQKNIVDALNREFQDSRKKHEQLMVQLRKFEPLEQQVRAIEGAQEHVKEEIEAQKAAAHALQSELRKVSSDFNDFRDNQGLMQSFSAASSGSGGADFSKVFSRLADMRKAQETATDDLRGQMNKIVDESNTMQQLINRLQVDVRFLNERAEKQTAIIGDWLEREEDDKLYWVRQAEADLLHEKEALTKALHAQERVGLSFFDLGQHIVALRKDLDRAVEVLSMKLPDVQKLQKVYLSLRNQLPGFLSLPGSFHESFRRIGTSIDTNHFSNDDASTLRDKVTVLTQMLGTLEQHNGDLSKQCQQVKENLDDLSALWNAKMHNDMLQKYMILSKELQELVKNGVARGAATVHPTATKAAVVNDGPVDAKMFETKLIGTNRRLAEIEDTLRAMSKNLVLYRSDIGDRVTASGLSKLKFQIYSELAKIHAILGSARFTTPGNTVVSDDTDVKSTLDAQAELIANLCSDLKQSLAEKPQGTDEKGNPIAMLSRLGVDDEQFSSKLESITDKVAAMFVNLEANRNSIQPKHAIPTYNPAQMLDSFALNIEAKLAESQNLTKLQIDSIKNELNDAIRQRVSKALSTIRDNLPLGEETTAGGAKPVMCIACSRPVRVETSLQDCVHDRLPIETPLAKVPHDPIMDILEPSSDEYHVYRAGFRMPQHEKRGIGKNVLPLLPSSPTTLSPTKRSKKKLHDTYQSLMAHSMDSGGSKWNNDAFSTSLGADLLTFSVAPLTHLMKTVGTTIQTHDTLLDELSEALKKLSHQQHQIQTDVGVLKASDTGEFRDEIMGMVDGIEKRMEASEAEIAQATALGHSIGGKLAIIQEHECKIDEVEQNVKSLNTNVDQLKLKMSDYLLPSALDGLKEQILQEVKAMLASLIEPTNVRLDAVESEVFEDESDFIEMANNIIEEERERSNSIREGIHVPPVTQELQTSSLSTTVVAAPILPVVISTKRRPRKSTGNNNSLTTFATPLQSSVPGVSDEAINGLQNQIHDLVIRFDRTERERTMLTEKITIFQEDIKKEIDEITTRQPTFAAPLPSVLDAKPVETLTNPAYESTLEQHSIKLNDLVKQLQSLERDQENATSIVDTIKGAMKTTQEDLRKLRHQVDEFQETQQLMQSFSSPAVASTSGEPTTSGSSPPDLSLVFSKLTDMRQAQMAASEELREALDNLAEKTNEQGRELQRWKDSLGRDNTVATQRAEDEINKTKEVLNKQLHQQTELIANMNDWLQHGQELHRDFEKPENRKNNRIGDLQSIVRQYYYLAPSIAQLTAAPAQHQHNLFRLRLSSQEFPETMEQLSAVSQQVTALDKQNENLLRLYDQVRIMIDELWYIWHQTQHGSLSAKCNQLAKELDELRALQQVLARPGNNQAKVVEVERKVVTPINIVDVPASLSGNANETQKKVEQLLLSSQRRMDGFEDDLRVLSRNVLAYRNDIADKVTEGNLSKLKFQIFSELAKIHSIIGSSKFNPPSKSLEQIQVYDDSDIKSTLDTQAEMIAKLCSDLKKERDESAFKQENIPALPSELEKFASESERFNTRLESITEKVAEMFVSLEVNRSASQPRHTIPVYNPAQMLDAFAQNIEAKLAETQDLTKKDIERIKSELSDNVRSRVRRAMESIKEQLPMSLDGATTAIGTVPGMVCCIACSRPVRFDVSTGDAPREVSPEMLGLPNNEEEDLSSERDDPEFVYRAGFRMPVNEKRNILPLLVSPRLPAKGRHDKSKGRRQYKSKDPNAIFREVDELDQNALASTEKPLRSIDKKATEMRRPVAPARP
ncbi:neutral ceramidase [Thraustotheca clavata]|uniref:ceramidase n=1 Tax=Thraustotheca clavata TaxID=74557 RepID=A0A1W0A5V2_9STRA|nr:neutral ceramidase [Thraustotheca clavata]